MFRRVNQFDFRKWLRKNKSHNISYSPINMDLAVMSDGASHCNGGVSAVGVCIIDTSKPDHPIAEIGECIGNATNNEAEYKAFLRGTEAMLTLDIPKGTKVGKIMFLMDSNMVVSQINGVMRCKAMELKPLLEQAKSSLEKVTVKFKCPVTVAHIPREFNGKADALAEGAVEKGVEDSVKKEYPFLAKL